MHLVQVSSGEQGFNLSPFTSDTFTAPATGLQELYLGKGCSWLAWRLCTVILDFLKMKLDKVHEGSCRMALICV